MLVKKKTVDAGGKRIPLDIHVERRNGWRVSVGKNAVILRLPDYATEADMTKHEATAIQWLLEIARKKPQSLDHLIIRELDENMQKFAVLGTEYRLHFEFSDRESLKAVREGADIKLHLPEILRKPNPDQNNTINQLVSRLISSKYLQRITDKTMDLNKQHFGRHINDVKLKYLHSRWGSCSSRRNINLSSRLLLAPEPVMDYVIIHELAHLVEMNHSAAFWKLVGKADSSYEMKEKWLKKNGHLCHFVR